MIETDTQPTVKFQIGQIYSARSIGDSDCIFSYTVIKRTSKQITIQDERGEIVRKGVEIRHGSETCYPAGKYSMAHSIRANDTRDFLPRF
jgi:hypothetical protein